MSSQSIYSAVVENLIGSAPVQCPHDNAKNGRIHEALIDILRGRTEAEAVTKDELYQLLHNRGIDTSEKYAYRQIALLPADQCSRTKKRTAKGQMAAAYYDPGAERTTPEPSSEQPAPSASPNRKSAAPRPRIAVYDDLSIDVIAGYTVIHLDVDTVIRMTQMIKACAIARTEA